MSRSEPVLSGRGITSVARNTSYLLGGQWIVRVFRLVYAIVLARYLGPELYGLFNYGLSWYLSFLPLSGIGLAVILIREVSRDRVHSVRFVAQTLTLRASLAIVAAAACSVLGYFSEGVPEARKLLLVFSIALIGRAVAIWTEQVFTAYEANKYCFQQQAIFRSFEVVFGTVFLLFGGGLLSVVAIHTMSWWIQALSGLALVRRHMVAIGLNFAWRSLKSILAQSWPIGLSVIIVNWLQQGPIILFRHISGSENGLGQLVLALQAFLILCAASTAASTASLPVLSRAVARNDGKDRLFAEVMLKGSLILGTAAGLAGLGAAPCLVDAIFGARYAEAGHLFKLTLWLLIPWACGNAIWSLYLARGQFVLPTVCVGAGAVVLIVSMPWLVSKMGTQGAVLATGAGMSVWALSLIAMLARLGDLDVREAILRPAAAILLSLGVFFAVKPGSVWLPLPASWLALIGGTLAFGVITPDERSALASIVHRRFSYREVPEKAGSK